ncbi:MAG: serine/threonine protein kinase [Planctomycetales bacterium]|nr:serine/threonine protein kinase [Planctomycetales bacterium]
MTSHCSQSDRIALMFDGKLTSEQEAAFGDHIESCRSCQERFEVLSKSVVDPAVFSVPIPGKTLLALDNVITTLQQDRNSAHQEVKRGKSIDQFISRILEPSSEPQSLGRLGQYEVLENIGSGGMGIVLKAHDRVLNRVHAIKIMAPHLAVHAGARQRFQREARAVAAIRHDNVVTVHSVFETDGIVCLVMEYIDGESLQQRIDTNGRMELHAILRIAIQVASGLAAAHAQGLVHRDIKPANILLERGVERVTITDFGLARVVDSAQHTQTGVIAGTPEYMSPEQAVGESVDHRSDLFSLGALIYTMAAGRPPFQGKSMFDVLKQVCEDRPQALSELQSDIPGWLSGIVDKLMDKNPDERFQSASDVARMLSAHLAHLENPLVAPAPVSLLHKSAWKWGDWFSRSTRKASAILREALELTSVGERIATVTFLVFVIVGIVRPGFESTRGFWSELGAVFCSCGASALCATCILLRCHTWQQRLLSAFMLALSILVWNRNLPEFAALCVGGSAGGLSIFLFLASNDYWILGDKDSGLQGQYKMHAAERIIWLALFPICAIIAAHLYRTSTVSPWNLVFAYASLVTSGTIAGIMVLSSMNKMLQVFLILGLLLYPLPVVCLTTGVRYNLLLLVIPAAQFVATCSICYGCRVLGLRLRAVHST